MFGIVKRSVLSTPSRRRLGGHLAHVTEDLALSSKTTVHGVLNRGSFAAGFRTGSKMDRRTVTLENMNPNIIKMEYAVRGPLVIRATEIEKELKKGAKKPFKEVIRANIGDCHAMGQKPLTFIRQVLTLCTYPALMTDDRFPNDVKKRAQDILNGCGGKSVGAYSDSTGVEVIKQHIAQYIERRDGYPANPMDIILSTGASEAVKSVLSMLNCTRNGKPPGIMIPIPQYPLYSATIAEYGMHQINYYLAEDNAWALDIAELKRSLNESRKSCEPRALCVINPGNPTGSVLTLENIKEIIKFAYEEKLFLLADEVYQDNVYASGMQFHSFKKVMTEMGEPYKNMELASFMSASKGYMGECGLRGGYAEIINLDPDVKKMLLKCVSARLCSSVLGQATMDCVVNPPQKGEPSYDIFIKEKTAVLQSLKERALLVEKTFNSMRGIKCNVVAGAMYAFPRLTLPEKAIEKAKSLGQAPDFFYAMQLLENTGICVVPGSGFGQIPGTFHFRTTILPQPEKLKIMLQKLEEYHNKFLEEYK
ncbi:alanine aminotransferase 1-like [Argiope bruennichi]|uniref:alanine transaminase n=1 Tax=Argiope bruennichi TaxID=94029 RepID=A0A8T0F2B2_ARGBR|nr:alanine aminotransferase 1-like [Argiope bruennichi]XP_055933399.1 alanine aminotransferase 1-like [Argiope bruennichi]KAF8782672.1 Alanine aminotransferase 2 like protein [Argiope bruennichi]